jgi:signal peptidase II
VPESPVTEQPQPEAAPATEPEAAPQAKAAPRGVFGPMRWVVLLAVTLLVAAADQGAKHWAETDLQTRPGRRLVVVEGYASLAYVRNPGAAWGLLASAKASFRRPFFFFVNLAAMVFILAIFARLAPGQALLMAALSLVMGGAVGNCIDRIRLGYVIDFILLHFHNRFRWPNFNVADIAITVGVLLLLLEMILIGRGGAPRRPAPPAPAGDA